MRRFYNQMVMGARRGILQSLAQCALELPQFFNPVLTNGHAGRRSNLYFFRDAKGFEIDLILDEQRQPRPIEIKSTHTYDSNLARNVRQFQTMVPESLPPHLVYAGAPMGCVQGVSVDSYLDTYRIING